MADTKPAVSQTSPVSERLADRIGKTYRKGAGPQAYSVGELSLDDLNLICASLRSFHHAQTPADEIARLRAQVEYWRIAAERREERKERSGVDVAEARTLDLDTLTDTSTLQTAERCPTCDKNDVEFRLSQTRSDFRCCTDPWHADDHLRRARSVTSPTSNRKDE